MTADGRCDPAKPRARFFGRSRGKALRPWRERLVADVLPKLELVPDDLARPGLFPFEPRETWLEIGFGAGEHLIDRAMSNPDIGLVGCEPFLNGVAAALAGIERQMLTNVRLWRGDAQTLVELAPDAFFSRVFILYPDPWPKRRHHRRRVISTTTVEALARVMRQGAELRFATDVDDYAGWTLGRFLASPHFRWAASRAEDWRAHWPEWRPTRYEAKAHRAGRGSVYLTFVRL